MMEASYYVKCLCKTTVQHQSKSLDKFHFSDMCWIISGIVAWNHCFLIDLDAKQIRSNFETLWRFYEKTLYTKRRKSTYIWTRLFQ